MTMKPVTTCFYHWQKANESKVRFIFSSLVSAAICLLKKLLEPDPNKRPNIHQVMADSWLQLANKNTGTPYLKR